MADLNIQTNTPNKPYLDVPFLPFENHGQNSRHGAEFFKNVKQLQVGYGTSVFRVDREGMWAGGETFATAKWSVDWLGNMIVTTGTITGATIQTSASGKRVVMADDKIEIYNASDVLVGTFSGLTGTYASGIQVNVAEIDVIALSDSGASSTVGVTKDGVVVVDTGDLYLSTRKADNSGGNVALKAGTSNNIVSYNNLIPNADGSLYLGNLSFGWGRMYLGNDGKYLNNNAGVLEWDGSPFGTGTVTSVATSGAISGGTITTTGTITHLTTAGYKHIPTGGATDKFLKYSASGTATWEYLSGTNCGSLIPSVSSVTLGNSSFYWNGAYIEDLFVNSIDDRTGGSVLVKTDLLSNSTGHDLGGSSNRFGTFYGVSINITGNAQIDGNINGLQKISFDAQTANPTSDGQLLYYDSGGTEGLQMQFGGADFQFDATGV